MELSRHTVLITGGGSGIGLALAKIFLQAGSEVIICGRRSHKLQEAQTQYPKIQVRTCDIENASERVALFEATISEFPQLDVLVNNAGIQRRLQLARDAQWAHIHQEIAINFEAQVHLCLLFVPYLEKQEHPAIINVTSGLSFVPLAAAPIYSATKAALHSFTLSLRQQLSKTPIKVIEIVPPAVNTDLGGPGMHTFGAPLDEFANAIGSRLQSDDQELCYGFSEQTSRASRQELDAIFLRMNQPDP